MRLVLITLVILTAASALYATPTAVPEIDPSSIGSALALAIGGGMVVLSRFRRK